MSDAIGKKFNRWTIVRKADRSRYVVAQCDCGTIRETYSYNIVSGATKSCGCYQHEVRCRTDNKFRKWTPEQKYTLRSYRAMIDRCEREGCNGYEQYGGRGVKVCERWKSSAEAFLTDMGLRPRGQSLDRIDPNGDYTPENCRWATVREQANNKVDSHFLTVDGETKTIAEWATLTGIGHSTIKERIKRGWSHKDAVSVKPLRKGVDFFYTKKLPQTWRPSEVDA